MLIVKLRTISSLPAFSRVISLSFIFSYQISRYNNRLKLRFRNEDERARFIDGWAERFCETDDAEWNIAVTIMTARRREPNFYNMEKALREAQGIRRERILEKKRRENDQANTTNAQKRALQKQGSSNLQPTPKTPYEIAQEALLRYERRGRKVKIQL
ncbi:hypothetical protein [Phascolarctobacterium faecium]|uniref:hypothetical protein n=1 Tax=Phascolarctobacterium faecium TaxID=33025 RepID=UPI0027BB03EE|nr:hypothetical protein [Phascolarctobacterium faecium]